MNKHFKISLFKSILRILGCIVCIILILINLYKEGLIVLSSSLLGAELLGILEEIKDERK